MKTYILDILNRYKRFSENLDAQTILCNKSWWIFNDSGEKELYIFQEDGSLVISISGRVINAEWKYITANKSLIITSKEQSYMLHPAFMDDTIFALRIDGTQESCFMIDENNRSSFHPKSLSDLNNYFEEKQKRLERKEKEEKVRLQRQKLASERWQAQQAEIERARALEEARKKDAEVAWGYEKDNIIKSDTKYIECVTRKKEIGKRTTIFFTMCMIVPLFLVISISSLIVETFDGWGVIGLIVVPSLFMLMPFYYSPYQNDESEAEWAVEARERQLHDKFIEDYYKSHPIE